MYKLVIRTFDPVPKTNIELELNISFGLFKNKKEAEKEANSVKKIILQKKPSFLKIVTKTNEYIIINNKSITFRKVKNESINKKILSENDFIKLEDFKFEELAKYFKNGYSFQIVACGIEKDI